MATGSQSSDVIASRAASASVECAAFTSGGNPEVQQQLLAQLQKSASSLFSNLNPHQKEMMQRMGQVGTAQLMAAAALQQRSGQQLTKEQQQMLAAAILQQTNKTQAAAQAASTTSSNFPLYTFTPSASSTPINQPNSASSGLPAAKSSEKNHPFVFDMPEKTPLREKLPKKETEIEKLSRVVEEQREEIEALKNFKNRSQLLRDAEFLANENLKGERMRMNENRINEIRGCHREEIARKDEDIERLRREIEALKKEAHQNAPSGVRIIRLQKVNAKIGAGHHGTSIKSIDKGAPADLAGLLVGDQLISINGSNVELMNKNQITKLSEDIGDDVTLAVRYNPERLADLEGK